MGPGFSPARTPCRSGAQPVARLNYRVCPVRGTVWAVTAVYVASPLGFSEPGRHYRDSVLHPRLRAAGWEVLDPWEDETGVVAATLALPPGTARREALMRMSRTIAAHNRALLGAAQAVLALLDGPDADSGTAAEAGSAAPPRLP